MDTLKAETSAAMASLAERESDIAAAAAKEQAKLPKVVNDSEDKKDGKC